MTINPNVSLATAHMPMCGMAGIMPATAGVAAVPSYASYEVAPLVTSQASVDPGCTSITARTLPSKTKNTAPFLTTLFLSALAVLGCAKSFRHFVPEIIDGDRADNITSLETEGHYWRGCAKATGGDHPYTKGYHPFTYGGKDLIYKELIRKGRDCVSNHARNGDQGIFEYVVTGNVNKPGKWKIRAACSRVDGQSNFTDDSYVRLFNERVKSYCEKKGGAYSRFTTSDLVEWNPQCVLPSGEKIVWGTCGRLGNND